MEIVLLLQCAVVEGLSIALLLCEGPDCLDVVLVGLPLCPRLSHWLVTANHKPPRQTSDGGDTQMTPPVNAERPTLTS